MSSVSRDDDNTERLKGLMRRVDEADGDLTVLTNDERRELIRLLDARVGELEFGYPIHGET